MTDSAETYSPTRGLKFKAAVGAVIAAVILATVVISVLPPGGFPSGRLIEIPEGSSLDQVAAILKEEGAIRSRTVFKMVVKLSGGETGLLAGEYFFKTPSTVFDIARKVVAGEFGIPPLKVVIPEGSTLEEMAAILNKTYPRFDPVEFLTLSEGEEGYLFPDTYRFLQNVRSAQVVKEMRKNFDVKIETVSDLLASSSHSLHDIITMASLIEKEAWISEDRRLISGVLWNRIEIGMPLQVDAVFPYIIGKNTYQLTLEDLKVESPYNTYQHRGLPPGPIGAPSLDSIEAALDPTPSNYYYYLADSDGRTHFATTFEAHKANKFKYLR